MTVTTRSRATALLVAVIVTLSTLVAAPAHASPRARTGPEKLAEDVVLRLHSEARAHPDRFGYAVAPVGPATPYTDIRAVARGWSDRQAAALKMSHNPDFSAQLCCWRTVGENVAYITVRSLDDAAVEAASRRIFQAWMDSDGHRKNILNGAYDQFGLGVSITPSSHGYSMYLTTNFRATTGTPHGSAYAPSSSDSTRQSAPEPTAYDTAACPEGDYERGQFTDSITGVHAGAIDCMLWWGIVTAGDAAGDTFRQGDVATRGFMAAVVDRLATAAGEPLPEATRDHFRDDDGHRYEGAVNRVVEAGIAGGFPDGSFRPDASLTRAQMATFLAKVYRDWLAFEAPRVSDMFDDDATSLHEANIDLVATVDIAHGTGTRQFSPNRSLTRGQLASFAARTADHLARAGVSPA